MSSDYNGNGNGNGLAQPKTPEEIAQESLRKIAPQIRRAVRGMKICAAAKFLFDAILDDSFMFDFGGDGHGRLIASVRDLSQRYGHDKDSISKWAEILRRKEVLWFDSGWPWREWRITAICQAPDMKASALQKIKARASARRHENKAEGVGGGVLAAQNDHSPLISEEIGGLERDVSPHKAEGIGAFGGRCRNTPPIPSAINRGHLPPDGPIPSARLAEAYRRDVPTSSAKASEDRGTGAAVSAIATGKRTALEKSPDVRSGALESSSNVQRGAERLKRKGGEAEFLADVAEVMGLYSPKYAKREMENSGGWWRMKFRQSPDKSWRVLGEIKSMILENKILNNPGSAAVDLWSRLP